MTKDWKSTLKEAKTEFPKHRHRTSKKLTIKEVITQETAEYTRISPNIVRKRTILVSN